MSLFKRLYKYGNAVNSHDALKALAIIAMFIDHAGFYFFPEDLGFRVLGRIAAPLFFFVVGYSEKFHIRTSLIVYGVLLTLANYYIDHWTLLNILLNFACVSIFLDYFKPERIKSLWLITLFILLISAYYLTDSWLEYGSLGILFALGGRLIATQDARGLYWLLVTLLFYFITQSWNFNFMQSGFSEYGFAIICLGLFFVLGFYRMRAFSLPAAVRLPTLFLSRYSLAIYFYHLMGLKLLSIIMRGL